MNLQIVLDYFNGERFDAERIEELYLTAYVYGIFLIGLPMAIVSVTCYLLEDKLDEHWYFWPLKMARNFVHPGSFIFLPDCEYGARENDRHNYEGPIDGFIDVYDVKISSVLFYIVLASIMWPARLYFSLMAFAFAACAAIIASPILLLYWTCKLIGVSISLIYESIRKMAAKLEPLIRGGPLNLEEFNKKFVEGNEALRKGNTEGLKEGIACFIESLKYADGYANELVPAIKALRRALSHHDRADTKGPWNRDLSGYGLGSWRNDLIDRDTALGIAWPHIAKINVVLQAQGLGWKF